MKRKTFAKLAAILMALVMLLSLFPAMSFAGEDVQIACFPGYVHQITNSGVTTYERNAAAARDVLRYSARLTEFDEPQKAAADVNFDGKITAADARILLRYTARLQGFPVKLRVGQTLRFGPFSALWELVSRTESSEKLIVSREISPKSSQEPTVPGSADAYTLCVTPNSPGSYVFEAEYIGYTDKVEKAVRFDIICAA